MGYLKRLLVGWLSVKVTNGAMSIIDVENHFQNLDQRQEPPLLLANQSVLPPGWSGNPQCWAECSQSDPVSRFLLGPSFDDPVSMTIEKCVSFCDTEDYLLAGLFASECRCANFFNPFTCFENDGEGECDFPSPVDGPSDFGGRPCPGNPIESCGNNAPLSAPFSAPWLLNIFVKGELCQEIWGGGAQLGSGSWRFAYYYNDTVGARALPHNAVDLHPGLPRGNLTVAACVTACQASGFLLAGVEFGDECYCGNALEHNSQPLSQCNGVPANAGALRCTGDPQNFCGGPHLIYVYTLPGSPLTPLLPFDPVFDGLQ